MTRDPGRRGRRRRRTRRAPRPGHPAGPRSGDPLPGSTPDLLEIDPQEPRGVSVVERLQGAARQPHPIDGAAPRNGNRARYGAVARLEERVGAQEERAPLLTSEELGIEEDSPSRYQDHTLLAAALHVA